MLETPVKISVNVLLGLSDICLKRKNYFSFSGEVRKS